MTDPASPIICTFCQGKGHSNETCVNCRGGGSVNTSMRGHESVALGYSPGVCRMCNGTGRKLCEVCRGARRIRQHTDWFTDFYTACTLGTRTVRVGTYPTGEPHMAVIRCDQCEGTKRVTRWETRWIAALLPLGSTLRQDGQASRQDAPGTTDTVPGCGRSQ
jgi:hypothetical protein